MVRSNTGSKIGDVEMSNYVEHALREFEILGWPGDSAIQKDICDHILDLLQVFLAEGHSSASAPYTVNLFKRLAMFKPISALTGHDDEWLEVTDDLYQNKRDGEVFKNKDGAYWHCGKVFYDGLDKDGSPNPTYTCSDSRVPITFPWTRPDKPEYINTEYQMSDTGISEKELAQKQAQTAAALCWTTDANRHTPMDTDLCDAFVAVLAPFMAEVRERVDYAHRAKILLRRAEMLLRGEAKNNCIDPGGRYWDLIDAINELIEETI